VFQVDEEAEGLQASILGCSADVTLANKLTSKLTGRTNGPVEGSNAVQDNRTKSSSSSNETH